MALGRLGCRKLPVCVMVMAATYKEVIQSDLMELFFNGSDAYQSELKTLAGNDL